jgi:glycosyltransferase involved in cell wall biosynthesis
MLEKTRVSIILCTYNGQAYLEKQLESIINQTYTHFEVIAIDDHSTDGTYELLQQTAAKDARFVVSQNTQTKGINQNFEQGIAQANGEYLLFCDQDDIWENTKLEHLLDHLNGSLLYYHNSLLINGDDISLGKTTADIYAMRSNLYPLSFLLLNAVSGHSCMFHRDVLSHGLLPFPDSIYYDNWVAYIAALHGRITYIDACLVRYRIHGNNYAASKIKKHRLDDKLIRDCHQQLHQFAERTPATAPFHDWLIRLRDTYLDNRLHRRLYRIFLLLNYMKSLTAIRKKNGLHRFALCLKMAYKPLPNLRQFS